MINKKFDYQFRPITVFIYSEDYQAGDKMEFSVHAYLPEYSSLRDFTISVYSEQNLMI